MKKKRWKLSLILLAFVCLLPQPAQARPTVSNVFAGDTAAVISAYQSAYGWDTSKMQVEEWTDADGNTYTRQADYQEDWLVDLIQTTHEYMGLPYIGNDIGLGDFSNPGSPLYQAIQDGGIGGKIAQIALSQVGTRATGHPDYRRSKYHTWWGQNGLEWCAIFACWCINEAGCDIGTAATNAFPKTAGCSTMYSQLRVREFPIHNANDIYNGTSSYTPRPGDIYLFRQRDASLRSQYPFEHVGIVVGYDPETRTITTVEGNTGDSPGKVSQKTFNPESNALNGQWGWRAQYGVIVQMTYVLH